MIKNGCILDGTGSPWFRGDIGISTGRIDRIGHIDGGNRIIDASGLFVCPGFIDVHTHSDATILVNPQAESSVRQGVTTHVIGNCGMSLAPITEKNKEYSLARAKQYNVPCTWKSFGEYLNAVEEKGVSINIVGLVGHGTVRASVMGIDNRPPTREELDEMKKLVAESMEQGAFGMSVGLEYIPGCYSDTNELIECAKVVARYNGVYASHSRQRDAKANLAIMEASEIGANANVPVRISHIAERYPAPDGGVERSLKIIDESRAKGIDISADEELPPFLDGYAWSTGYLSKELFQEREPKITLDLLRDPDKRRELWAFLATTQYGPIYTLRGGVWDRVVLISSKKSPEFIGRNFQEIARAMGKKSEFGNVSIDKDMEIFNAAIELLIKEGEPDWRKVYVRIGRFTERDKIVKSASHAAVCFSSDSSVMAPYGILGKGSQSPRSYVSYLQVFRMHREGRINLPLEEIILKMTAHPAQRFRLFDRGLLRPGMWADIAIFDKNRVSDKATHEEPTKYPEGLMYVLVNGQVVVDKSQHNGSLPGKVLRWKP